MKRSFLVIFELPDPLPDAFVAGIPENRKTVERLMSQQHLQFFAVAADRSRCWAVVMADSEAGVLNIISEFPLIRFMEVGIQELAMLTTPVLTPSPSWN